MNRTHRQSGLPAQWLAITLLMLGLCLGGQASAQITVYPTTSTITLGSSRQFSAYVPLSPNAVTWSVNDIVGGNSTVGTISATGLYTPPVVAPANNDVVVKATSTPYPAQVGAAQLKITKKYPNLWGTYPSSLTLGSYEVSFNGSNFAPDSEALADGVPVQTIYVSPTKLIVRGDAPNPGAVVFAVRQPAPGMVVGNTVSVQVQPITVTVEIAPLSPSVALGSTRTFTKTVTGLANTSVNWYVNGIQGGASSVGTINSNGLYTAPSVMPAGGTVTVRAAAVGSLSKYAETQVTLTAPVVTVAVAPQGPVVQTGATRSFTRTVTGTGNTNVTWSVNGITGGNATIGTISSSGLYTAPAVVPSPASVLIRATSVPFPASYGESYAMITAPAATVTVSPQAPSVQLGATRTFTQTVTNAANNSVTWSVNGIAGGNSTVGTISAGGLYTAPAVMPVSGTVTVRATSVPSPAAYGESTVTLTAPPVVVAVSPTSASLQTGGSQTFTSTVSGSANTTVTWSVNGVTGGNSSVGIITPGGLYTAPAAVPSPATITVRATSTVNAASFATASVAITAPPGVTVNLSHARFLEQSSFGPSPASLAEVAQKGIPAYLQDQFNMPETVIPTPAGNSMSALSRWMLYNYSSAPDQLRQRVAYSLGQILVISANKLTYPDVMLPGLRLYSQHAFGNYRDLLKDMTKCPSMGKFLDLAGSAKASISGAPNENYPRELLQLFGIGLYMLDDDGTNLPGPVPTYDQQTIQEVSKALTGWVYANNQYENFTTPMVPSQSRHDTSSKTFLGVTLPANQTVEQDLDGVLDAIMNHPNIAPFISLRLIRSLVMSNPPPDYVERVSAVFNDNGSGVKGDLKAVVTAILLDPVARNDTPTVNSGRLKEPILQTCGLLRALGGQFNPGQELTYLYEYMGQGVLNPPSVFNWFSPLYRIPKTSLFGPEFQIYSPTDATLRGNLMNILIGGNSTYFTIDLSPFQPYGNDMAGLVDVVNQKLLYGRMPAGMKQVLINAAAPGYDAKTRIETVLYLVALSGQYAVQH